MPGSGTEWTTPSDWSGSNRSWGPWPVHDVGVGVVPFVCVCGLICTYVRVPKQATIIAVCWDVGMRRENRSAGNYRDSRGGAQGRMNQAWALYLRCARLGGRRLVLEGLVVCTWFYKLQGSAVYSEHTSSISHLLFPPCCCCYMGKHAAYINARKLPQFWWRVLGREATRNADLTLLL